jgi:hypothetical protein
MNIAYMEKKHTVPMYTYLAGGQTPLCPFNKTTKRNEINKSHEESRLNKSDLYSLTNSTLNKNEIKL